MCLVNWINTEWILILYFNLTANIVLNLFAKWIQSICSIAMKIYIKILYMWCTDKLPLRDPSMNDTHVFDSFPQRDPNLITLSRCAQKYSYQWINSYLSDSEHFVTWNQTHSPLLNLNIGVPQGSILEPLLFLIYIKEIPVISCHSFSLLLTPLYMFNMIQLMVQFKSLTRN